MFRDYATVGAQTGYRLVYRPRETNHCPGCSQTHWIVGRSSAECAFCGTALPLQDAGASGTGLFRSSSTHRVAA